ncbi:hypothetical protein WMY93_026602 [Mugilogobius chulae]|uniref:Uncharacterized protein n=1 Tax=Mugilogobius chulae TaxID=88201 RepID=A0AAW0MXZ0_9GOBI
MDVWQHHPKPHQLFYLCPPESHTHLAYLVKSLWRGAFPDKPFGEDDYLDGVYFTYYMRQDEANLQVCPYFFDNVTESLWDYHHRRPRDLGCLHLCCFYSWSSLKEEISRAFLSTTEEKRNGVHFSHRCRPVTRNPNRILSSRQYLQELHRLPLQ